MRQVISILLTVLILILPCGRALANQLDIAVHEFCPYLCNPEMEDGKEGYVAEIIRSIYGDAGYQVQFHWVPYVRGIKMTESGQYDGMPMLNAFSSQKIPMSDESVGVLNQNFYVKKGDPWRYGGIGSLEDIVVGSIIGYNYSVLDPQYESYLRKHRHSEKVVYTAGEDATLINLKKLLAGRIRTFNECSDRVDYLAAKAGFIDKLGVAGSLGALDNYLGFSPLRSDHVTLLSIFDRGIVALRESGQLEKILSRYELKDWID